MCVSRPHFDTRSGHDLGADAGGTWAGISEQLGSHSDARHRERYLPGDPSRPGRRGSSSPGHRRSIAPSDSSLVLDFARETTPGRNASATRIARTLFAVRCGARIFAGLDAGKTATMTGGKRRDASSPVTPGGARTTVRHSDVESLAPRRQHR